MFGWGPTLYYMRTKHTYEVKKLEEGKGERRCYIIIGNGLTRHQANELLAKCRVEDPENRDKYTIGVFIEEEVSKEGWTKEQIHELLRKETEP
mgnify:CR=1 FL=1